MDHRLKFNTEISRSVVVQEALKAGQTILQYQGDHPVAAQYLAERRKMMQWWADYLDGVPKTSAKFKN